MCITVTGMEGVLPAEGLDRQHRVEHLQHNQYLLIKPFFIQDLDSRRVFHPGSILTFT